MNVGGVDGVISTGTDKCGEALSTGEGGKVILGQ